MALTTLISDKGEPNFHRSPPCPALPPGTPPLVAPQPGPRATGSRARQAHRSGATHATARPGDGGEDDDPDDEEEAPPRLGARP